MSRFHQLFLRLKTSRLQKLLKPKGPKGHQGRNLPRIVWIFWAQGPKEAPPIVRDCIASWKQKNPDWDVRVLNTTTAAETVDLTDLEPDIPLETMSDILRLRLLKTHGGVWADATLYCQVPLDNWLYILMPSGAFFFRKPKPERVMANWFMAAFPDHPLIVAIEQEASDYWQGRSKAGTYFWFHFTVEYLIRTRLSLRHNFLQMPALSAEPALRLQRHLRGKSAEESSPDLTGVPLHKLSWKHQVSQDRALGIISSSSDHSDKL